MVATGFDIFAEHVAVGHLADDGMHPVVGENGLDRGLFLLEALVDELLEFRR